MSAPTKQCLQRLQRELRAIKQEEEAAKAAKAGAGDSGSSEAATTTTDTGAGGEKTHPTAPTSHAGKSAFVTARPDPKNILNWYFLINGPEATPYAGGRYIGTLRFPGDYPFKPPTIMILTPNGRFQTDTAICMSNSSFHPEQWSPIWSVQTIVLGFVSFMVSDEGATGGIVQPVEERQKLARASCKFNVTSLKYIFEQTMPEHYAEDVQYLKDEEERMALSQRPPVQGNPTSSQRKEASVGSSTGDAATPAHPSSASLADSQKENAEREASERQTQPGGQQDKSNGDRNNNNNHPIPAAAHLQNAKAGPWRNYSWIGIAFFAFVVLLGLVVGSL